MIEPRTMYDITVYDYKSLDPELKRHTDVRNHSMYVTKLRSRGDITEVTVVNLNGITGEEEYKTLTIQSTNIYSVRNVKTNTYLFSMSPGLSCD